MRWYFFFFFPGPFGAYKSGAAKTQMVTWEDIPEAESFGVGDGMYSEDEWVFYISSFYWQYNLVGVVSSLCTVPVLKLGCGGRGG